METVRKRKFTPGLTAKGGVSLKIANFMAFGADAILGINALSSYYLIPMVKIEIGKIY